MANLFFKKYKKEWLSAKRKLCFNEQNISVWHVPCMSPDYLPRVVCQQCKNIAHRCDQCILFIIDMGRFMTIIKATSPPLRRELSLNHARFLWLQCQVSGRGRSAVHPVPPHLCRAGAGTTAGNEGPRIFHNRRDGHPIRAFSWLKALTRAFPFKTLLTHCKLTPVYLA